MSIKHSVIARSGVMYYLKGELPSLGLTSIPRELKDERVFGVYRPAFVLEDAKSKFIGAPIRAEHKWVEDKDDPEIIGHISDDVSVHHDTEGGEVEIFASLDVDGSKMPPYRELSPGYTAKYKWKLGRARNGEEFQILCTKINDINHLAIVPMARGGEKMRVLDGGKSRVKVWSGLLRAVRRKLLGTTDAANGGFLSKLEDIRQNIDGYSAEDLSQRAQELNSLCMDLPDSDEKEKLVRCIADVPLLKDEDERIRDEAINILKDSYTALDNDAIEDVMVKKDEEEKKAVDEAIAADAGKDNDVAVDEKPTDVTPSDAETKDASDTEAPEEAPKDASEEKGSKDASDGDESVLEGVLAKLDKILSLLQSNVTDKDADVSTESVSADGEGCMGGSSKAVDAMPKYTQSLNAVQAGESLDDVFSKLKSRR